MSILQFAVNDWRNIIRDSSLRFFMLLPFLIMAMAIWGMPAVIAAVPILEDYRQVLAMFLGIQGSIMVGFIFSIVLLEEKEDNIHIAFRILPHSNASFLLARLLPSAVFAWLVGILILRFNGVWPCDWATTFKASLLYFFPSPAIVLMVSTFAKNRMEGMAFFKGIDLLIVSPALYFVFEGWGREFFRILPFWWVFAANQKAFDNAPDYWLTLLLGIGYNVLILFLLVTLFRKRYWQ